MSCRNGTHYRSLDGLKQQLKDKQQMLRDKKEEARDTRTALMKANFDQNVFDYLAAEDKSIKCKGEIKSFKIEIDELKRAIEILRSRLRNAVTSSHTTTPAS